MGKPKRSAQNKHTARATIDGSQYGYDELRRRARDYAAKGQVIPALEVLNSLIEAGQACVEDWCLGGDLLRSVGEFAQAVTVLEQGLQLDSEHEACRFNLAAALFQLGDVTSAVHHFEWVAERYNNLHARLNLAMIIPGCPDVSHQRLLEIRQTFAAGLRAMPDTNKPCVFRSRAAEERLRVGYISAFLHRSNYMKPVWGLINGHDRQQFDIYLFADDTKGNGLAWFKPGAHDHIHYTQSLDNAQLVSLIHEQQLDIVVDLNGYSMASRLEILLSRLAPVTVTWFNMYATSGLPGIDWIIGDEFVVRPDEEPFYSEKICRLPQSYLSFVVGHESPDISPPPCLTSQRFTFGSLVSQYKITPAVLDAWSEILKRSPGSQLVLANRAIAKTANRDYITRQFVQRGVTSERIKLLPPAEHFDFLKYYDQIDIALDSFPYNGGTTTTEAIWQGVPVLTFDGDRWASRTSRTLLMNCHLSEFVATGVLDYIDSAVHWAIDPISPQRLNTLRTEMRTSLLNSSVCQTGNMVQAMETLYVQLANKAVAD